MGNEITILVHKLQEQYRVTVASILPILSNEFNMILEKKCNNMKKHRLVYGCL